MSVNFCNSGLRLVSAPGVRNERHLFYSSLQSTRTRNFQASGGGKRHDVVGFGNVATVRSSVWIAIKGMAAGNNIIQKVSAPLHGPVAGRSMRCRWRCTTLMQC